MEKYCFLDVETTGVDSSKHGILQISGMIRVEGKPEEFFDFKVRAFKEDLIDPEAIKISGLDPEKGLAPDQVHIELLRIFTKYVDRYSKKDKFFFVGYNADFDNRFLRRFFEKCRDKYFGSWFWFPYIDLMTLAGFRLMKQRPAMENFKLATVCRVLGIEFDLMKAHDARYDIEKTVELFNKLVERE